ncbi:MAG TPA: endolytic transglycosylase MltG, partial [Roseiarcus sp.]|nr:endolytic transglycosylase MltG [Roseiarcus sp.]
MTDGSDQDGQQDERPRVSLFGRRVTPRSPSEALQPQSAPPPPEAPRKERREGLSRLSGVLSFALIAAVAGLGAFAWSLQEARRPGPLAADKVVILSREDEAEGATIADQLERAGVIDSAIWFNLVVLADGNRGKLKRGEYLFKEHASLREVEGTLVSGKPLQHKITIPEGLTSQQIVQKLRIEDALAGDVKETPREGSIMPDTYFFQRGESREALLGRMVKAQGKAVDEIWQSRAANLPIKSPGELITLASLVEKETGKADERPRVAGVFVNRLEKRMRLQSDPTIVYGLVGGKGTLGRGILKSEIEQATAYNTYVIEGLPPGPIANPGKAALEAAANPSRTKELYFVADGTGGHAFAETLDQHMKNVDHWRQIEKDAKDGKDRVSPDLLPATPAAAQPAAPANQKKSSLDLSDPKIFGALAPRAATKPKATLGALSSRLGKLGAERQARLALLGPNGPLSASAAGRGLADSGIIVEGVNDTPLDTPLSQAAAGDDAEAPGPVQTYPLPAQMLADQNSREARFASASEKLANADIGPVSTAKLAPNGRPRVIDASEGTPLDPLLNT